MIKFILNLLVFYFSSLYLQAQFEPVRNFSVKDGLPSGVVYDCLQDKQGFMWFATAAGLARFDGTNFKVFTADNGLTNNEILQIALADDGNIWVVPFGVKPCLFETATERIYNDKNYTPLRKLDYFNYPITVRQSKAGLVGFGKRVFFLDNKNISIIDTNVTPFIKDVWPINRDSILLFSTFDKSHLYTGGTVKEITPSLLKTGFIFSRSPDWGRWKILFDSTITTCLSLYEFTSTGTFAKRSEFKSPFPVNNINRYGDIVYVATRNGFYSVDTMLSKKEYSFAGRNISKIFIDKEGNEWVCSLSGEGVYLKLKNGVRQFNIASGLPVDNVTAIKQNKDGQLVCGDGDGNIYTLALSAAETRTLLRKKMSSAIRGISFKNGNEIIFSNDDIAYNGKKLPGTVGAIKTVIHDTTGNLWIGTHFAVWKYDLKNKKNTNANRNPTRYNSIEFYQGKYYFGNPSGLFEILGFTPSPYPLMQSKQIIPDKSVSHLIATKDEVLWIATNNDGVIAWKNNKIIGHFNISTSRPLLSSICKKLFVDEKTNSVWVATNKGINRIKYSISGDSLTAIVTEITSSEGLNDDDVNDLYVDGDTGYAATIKGICEFKTDLNKKAIPVIITDVKINNYTANDTSAAVQNIYRLSYTQNTISITYSGICYTCEGRISFKYRMLGVSKDTAWNLTRLNTIEFAELGPGQFTFQVATDNGSIQQLVFNIEPAFWQTGWFYILIFAAALLLMASLVFFIIKRIRKREAEKTSINKKMGELEFQALQSQMNPHFVFNAMNTLQNYILKNESENASEYLASFARVMRLFLESSRDKYIEMGTEIELLEKYIQLELARLKYPFHYKITVDEEIEMKEKIPSVIIQPFVENAILHGLRLRNDDKGLLNISFTMKENLLQCRVQDNGIGRAEAKKINAAKVTKYRSQGLKIIDEKIRTLKEINNIDIAIFITDNFNEDGSAAGTTVIINFNQRD